MKGGREKKLVWWACSIFVLGALIATISITFKWAAAKSIPQPSHTTKNAVSKSISLACRNTLYQASCETSLASMIGRPTTNPRSLTDLFELSVRFAIAKVYLAQANAVNLSRKSGFQAFSGMDDCVEVLEDSLEQLSSSIDKKKNPSPEDVQTWLSAALTNQQTCLNSLTAFKFPAGKELMNSKAGNLSQFISNSLAMYQSLRKKEPEKKSGGRRLLSKDDFPTWVSTKDRKLLDASPTEIDAHAIVAKDGTGTYETLAKAIEAAGSHGSGRFVIYLKAGTYSESVKISNKQKNVMLVGDGKGKTVITGHKNAVDGSTTFRSASFAASGEGFIARDITFENTAGPSKHQAVALRVGSDKSVIYRCSIVGYQDSLYAHSNRQFYRETDIFGTVDFIFGNSAVVFQNCNIYARKPMEHQRNTVTAQGRTDPNQNTGISIHNCNIKADSDLIPAKGRIPTYLGRPWHKYSRTVVMQSVLDGSIHPAGWLEWSGSFALKTLFYGEFKNSGAGAATSGRVRWPGYHGELAAVDASKFTVAEFIFGNAWLPSTGVEFDSGLLA